MSPHTSRKFFISQTNQGYILIYEKKKLLLHKLDKVEKYQPSSNGVFSSKFPFCIEGCTVKDWTQAKDRVNTKKSLKSMLTNL